MEGTFCGGKIQGDYASKIAHCAKCDYFKSEHHERNLDVSALKSNGAAKAAIAPGGAEAFKKTSPRPAPRKTLRQ